MSRTGKLLAFPPPHRKGNMIAILCKVVASLSPAREKAFYPFDGISMAVNGDLSEWIIQQLHASIAQRTIWCLELT